MGIVAAIVMVSRVVAKIIGVRMCFNNRSHRVSCYVSHNI